MKRILSSMLATAIILSLSVPAFSAEPEYKADPIYKAYELLSDSLVSDARKSREMKETITLYRDTDYSGFSKEQLLALLKKSHEITISVLDILIAVESRAIPKLKQTSDYLFEKYGR